MSLFLSTITTSPDSDCVTTYQVSVFGIIMLVNDKTCGKFCKQCVAGCIGYTNFQSIFPVLMNYFRETGTELETYAYIWG
jgi:hypothetical protein